GGTSIGRQVRRILLDAKNEDLRPRAELLLYFACRAQNVEEWIMPALERGEVVLSDRFTDSTLAYQGVGRGLGKDVVRDLHRIACRGLDPDLTLLIDIDLETSLARAQARNKQLADSGVEPETRMDDQAVEFHRRVREAYADLVREEPRRFIVIDGRAAIDVVAKAVWDAVAPRVGGLRV
ncbi:MAG: dTMP kinase, partial [Bryobacteraceae bacterium]